LPWKNGPGLIPVEVNSVAGDKSAFKIEQVAKSVVTDNDMLGSNVAQLLLVELVKTRRKESRSVVRWCDYGNCRHGDR